MKFRDRRVTVHVDYGQAELRIGLRELPFRLIEYGLKRAMVNFKQHLVLMNERPLPIVLFDQIARYLRLKLRICESIERGDPIANDRNIFFDNCYDRHYRGRHRRRCLFFATGDEDSKNGQETDRKCRYERGYGGRAIRHDWCLT